MTSISLYLVESGEAREADETTDFDGTNSVLIAARSPESALHIATAYDAGQVGIDNLAIDGRTVACVSMRDKFGALL